MRNMQNWAHSCQQSRGIHDFQICGWLQWQYFSIRTVLFQVYSVTVGSDRANRDLGSPTFVLRCIVSASSEPNTMFLVCCQFCFYSRSHKERTQLMWQATCLSTAAILNTCWEQPSCAGLDISLQCWRLASGEDKVKVWIAQIPPFAGKVSFRKAREWCVFRETIDTYVPIELSVLALAELLMSWHCLRDFLSLWTLSEALLRGVHWWASWFL